MIKNALLSVSDKTGIVDFAKGLVELTKSEKEKLMKKALEYHKSSQDEKLTRMIELLYYKKDFTLNSFTAWKIDKEEKDTYFLSYNMFHNI